MQKPIANQSQYCYMYIPPHHDPSHHTFPDEPALQEPDASNRLQDLHGSQHDRPSLYHRWQLSRNEHRVETREQRPNQRRSTATHRNEKGA